MGEEWPFATRGLGVAMLAAVLLIAVAIVRMVLDEREANAAKSLHTLCLDIAERCDPDGMAGCEAARRAGPDDTCFAEARDAYLCLANRPCWLMWTCSGAELKRCDARQRRKLYE